MCPSLNAEYENRHSTQNPDVLYWIENAGPNPFIKKRSELFFPVPDDVEPLDNLRVIPSLTSPSMTFIERLSSKKWGKDLDDRHKEVWKVSWKKEDNSSVEAVLKMYRRLSDYEKEDGIIDAFESECNAYAMAIRKDVTNKGFIPRCFGWFNFSPADYPNVPSYKTLPWDSLLCYDDLVDALLIEYIPWEPLSCYNVTDTIAQNILLSLRALHRAGIVHRDLEKDNGHVLVNQDHKIAFIDFDVSMTAEDYDPYDARFAMELYTMWELLIYYFLPNKRRIERGEKPYW